MKAFPYSQNNDVYFVAELGSNHNQDPDRLSLLVEAARICGFDAIKLQYYKAEKLWSKEFPDRIAMAKRGEITEEVLAHTKQLCNLHKIGFGCSVFNVEDIEVVSKYVDFLKVSSYECMNSELISKCKETNLPVFVSTGMCTRSEIYSITKEMKPNDEDCIFHCISSYPAEDARIDILKGIIQSFSHVCGAIGYSDHTRNIGSILAAINAGAKVIEMHFDLVDLKGNESRHGHCWYPETAFKTIDIANAMKKADVEQNWIDNFMSREDRKDIDLRADEKDCKRPSIKVRKEK